MTLRNVMVALAAVGALGAVAACGSERAVSTGAAAATSGASSAAAAAAADSGTCPATAPKTLQADVSDLTTTLEPLAATKVVLCAYPGLNASPSAKGGSTAPTPVVLTNPVLIRSLQGALNGLSAPPSGGEFCPNDDGAAVLGTFVSGSQEVQVLMHTSGCRVVTNGVKTGWVGASDLLSVLGSAIKAGT